MSNQALILDAVRSHLAGETVCETPPEAGGRVACLTPLEYPNGDGVLVWAAPEDGRFEVTDYGEAYMTLVDQPGPEQRVLLEMANALCVDAGVEFRAGRIGLRASLEDIGDAVWRVASTSAQIAQIASYYRPQRRHREHEFADVVHAAIVERYSGVLREERLPGKSGHVHRATFYIPATQSILEPVGAEGRWNQVATTYAKLGDLADSNGFGLFAILDDRGQEPKPDVVNMLIQVSQVVYWTRHEEWFTQIV
jgi:hypothetical protein